MATKKTVKTAATKSEPIKTVAAAVAEAVKQGDSVPAGRKPVGEISVKEATLAVFTAAKDKEFKTDEVVAAVSKSLPKVKKETVLWMMTELKKAGQIHRTRNDGHQHVLKFGPGSAVAAKSVAVSAGSNRNDLIVLKELTKLVEQRAALDLEIERLKKMI
jgi:hypothetical protein